MVNAYVMDGPGGSVLIDTGFPSAARKILAGVRALGKRPEDIRHILLTHAHPDHIGGAAALKRATGAEACVHALDASIVETGGPLHPMGTAPGLRNLVFRTLVSGWVKRVEGTVVDHRLEDGQPVPFDDDLRAFHVPGHCAGQLAFLWRRAGGVLFAADACVNMRGMQIPAAVEDYAMAKRDVEMLADLRFEVACFGHGPPIVGGADPVFRNGGCQGALDEDAAAVRDVGTALAGDAPDHARRPRASRTVDRIGVDGRPINSRDVSPSSNIALSRDLALRSVSGTVTRECGPRRREASRTSASGLSTYLTGPPPTSARMAA